MFDVVNATYREVTGFFISYELMELPQVRLKIDSDEICFSIFVNSKVEDEYRDKLLALYKNNAKQKNIDEFKINFVIEQIKNFSPLAFCIKGKPFESISGNKNYREDWKEILKQHIPEFLLEISKHLFDDSIYLKKKYGFDKEILRLNE